MKAISGLWIKIHYSCFASAKKNMEKIQIVSVDDKLHIYCIPLFLILGPNAMINQNVIKWENRRNYWRLSLSTRPAPWIPSNQRSAQCRRSHKGLHVLHCVLCRVSLGSGWDWRQVDTVSWNFLIKKDRCATRVITRQTAYYYLRHTTWASL